MKFSAFKFGKKVAPIDLSAPERLAQAAPKEVIQELPAGCTGSATSLRSNASSKKALWLLGPEAPCGDQSIFMSAKSSRSSLGMPQVEMESEPESDVESLSDSESDSEPEAEIDYLPSVEPASSPFDRTFNGPGTYNVDDASVKSDSSVYEAEITSCTSQEVPRASQNQSRHTTMSLSPKDSLDPSVLPSIVTGKPTTELEETTCSTSSSPDVDSLNVAQFPALQTESTYDPAVSRDAPATTVAATVDFEEVCERLRDSVDLPELATARPAFDHSNTSSTSSSCHSSAIIFTEPPTPSLSSSASSFNSLNDEEKLAQMEETKSALVADQAALEAKLKLAAARNALKKVKCNVASPMAAGLEPQTTRPTHLRTASTKLERPSHVRTLSGSLRSDKSRLSSSGSSNDFGSFNEINEESEEQERRSIGSTRSTRSSRDDRVPMPHKSTVKIGYAAPKDLSIMRHPSTKRLGLAPIKSKSKAQIYVPQNHITSIHEVLA